MRRPIERHRGRRWPSRAVLATALAGLWLVAAGSAAGAHALLRDSDPAAGSSLDQAPRRVVLWRSRSALVMVASARGQPSVSAPRTAP